MPASGRPFLISRIETWKRTHQPNTKNNMINEEAKITLTHENLHACANGGCGFTRAQVEMVGYTWPPTKGWVKGIIGDVVTASFYEEFKAAGQIRAGALKQMKREASAKHANQPLIWLFKLTKCAGKTTLTDAKNRPLADSVITQIEIALKSMANINPST